MTLDVAKIKRDFPILSREINGRRLAFLDSAASSQRPQSVLTAMDKYYQYTHANVHRGVYTMAQEATDAYEGSRKKIARFIGAPDSDCVIFTKNVTEALNLIARAWGGANISKGDVIVLTEMEHHANLVPWFQLAASTGAEIRFIKVREDGLLDLTNLDDTLRGAKIFSFTGVSNVLGTINPVQQLVEAGHKAGAVVAVDYAQWTPHMTTDVTADGADFVAFTGHKMLGPTGIGVLWGKREILEEMPPFLGGGDMILDVTLEGFTTNVLPWKFEAGTPPIAEVVGLAAAIDYLTPLGMDNIRAHEQELVAYALDSLQSTFGDKIRIHGTTDVEKRGGAISFALADAHPHDVGQVLDEYGVAIRAGHHCAKPLMRCLGETATARASFYIYNDQEDVDQLVDALEQTLKIFG